MTRELLSIFKESRDSFEGQEPGENVILLIRRHPFTIIVPLLFIFLFSLIPLLAWQVISGEIMKRGWSDLFFFASSIWLLFFWILGFYLLTLYALNTVIVTHKRIIESEQEGFFRRKVSELHIYRVQDVSVRTHGFFQTLLSFGDVSVQTAAEAREFNFYQIAHPEKVKDIIMKAVSSQRSGLRLD